MIVMSDTIYAARDVTKTNTTSLWAFKSPNWGPLGKILGKEIYFNYQVLKKHTTKSSFKIDKIKKL